MLHMDSAKIPINLTKGDAKLEAKVTLASTAIGFCENLNSHAEHLRSCRRDAWKK
jgi:hypothetical protein